MNDYASTLPPWPDFSLGDDAIYIVNSFRMKRLRLPPNSRVLSWLDDERAKLFVAKSLEETHRARVRFRDIFELHGEGPTFHASDPCLVSAISTLLLRGRYLVIRIDKSPLLNPATDEGKRRADRQIPATEPPSPEPRIPGVPEPKPAEGLSEVVCIRLIGMCFAANKAFLLPSAIEGIRGIKSIYDGYAGAELLAVGHTDTTGGIARNMSLSLQRANAVLAYLRDDVDVWLEHFSSAADFSRRWGDEEIREMLGMLPDPQHPYYEFGQISLTDAIARFREDHGLGEGAELDSATRRAIVAEYMSIDGTSLPPGTVATAHGCGEHFLDRPTGNGVAEPLNRRVELFIFPGGIRPRPVGTTSGASDGQYKAWRSAVADTRDFIHDGVQLDRIRTQIVIESLQIAARRLPAELMALHLASLFGTDIPLGAYKDFHAALLQGTVTSPEILVVPTPINGHEAAYDRTQSLIKVTTAVVDEAFGEQDLAWKLLIATTEETGHHIDHLLRNTFSTVGGDADLDEGARFAYAMLEPGWMTSQQRVWGHVVRREVENPLSVRWDLHAQAVDKWLSLDAQRTDDKDSIHEFFEAGPGKAITGSFGHQSIEEKAFGGIFEKDEIEQIYFGNWLRDFSQVCDPKIIRAPGASALSGLSRDAITKVIDVLARETFADLAEFRVTANTLGVYRPCEHIDNPNGITSDARAIDADFRGPVTAAELLINRKTLLKNYIATPGPGYTTSLEFMQAELQRAAYLGPTPAGRRHLGSALHVLEDYYAHSNFCEVALNVRGVSVETWVPMVETSDGREFSIVTGSFGSSDTAASLLAALAGKFAAEYKCIPGEASAAANMMLIILRDIEPHIAAQAGGVLAWEREIERQYPSFATLACRTLGRIAHLAKLLLAGLAHACETLTFEAQKLFLDDPNSTDPTHTLLAKDHDDHPLHTLAAECAVRADRLMAEAMADVWLNDADPARLYSLAAALLVHPREITADHPGFPIMQTIHLFRGDPANAAKIVEAKSRAHLVGIADAHRAEIRSVLTNIAGGVEEMWRTLGWGEDSR